MPKLRAVVFSVFMFWVTVVMGVLAIPTLVHQDWARALSKIWAHTLLRGLRIIGGIESDINGTEHLSHGPAVVAAKHQSMWETLALNIILPRPIFILKKELRYVPIFGWWTTRCGFIYVDRSAGAAALKRMVTDAENRIAHGATHLIIFPEGTRVAPGETGRYQPGVAALSKALSLPVIPAGHNSGTHWRHHDRTLVPGQIKLQFCSPVPQNLRRPDVMASVKHAIETTTATLEMQSSTNTASAPSYLEPHHE